MKRPIVLLMGLMTVAIAAAGPLAQTAKFDGSFVWIKLGTLPTATTKTFGKAKTIVVKVQFKKDIHFKKDKGGNAWFTIILSDQGSDWKWHQTTGAGAVPITGGVIKAGTYSVAIPVAGIPASVLKDKMQTISVGPASSGLASPTPIAVVAIKGT